MRTIDADALREVVQDHVTTMSVSPTIDYANGQRAFKKAVLADIDAAPTVTTLDAPDGGWISVEDRLPRKSDYRKWHDVPNGVVMWYNGTEVGLGWYYRGTKSWADVADDVVMGVTHWIPLPEPVKG